MSYVALSSGELWATDGDPADALGGDAPRLALNQTARAFDDSNEAVASAVLGNVGAETADAKAALACAHNPGTTQRTDLTPTSGMSASQRKEAPVLTRRVLVQQSDVPATWIAASPIELDALAAACPALPRNAVATATTGFAPSEYPPPAVYALTAAFPNRKEAYTAYDNALTPALRCLASLVLEHANDATPQRIQESPVAPEGVRTFGAAATVKDFTASVVGKGSQRVTLEAGYSGNVVLVIAFVSRADSPVAPAVMSRVLTEADRRMNAVPTA